MQPVWQAGVHRAVPLTAQNFELNLHIYIVVAWILLIVSRHFCCSKYLLLLLRWMHDAVRGDVCFSSTMPVVRQNEFMSICLRMNSHAYIRSFNITRVCVFTVHLPQMSQKCTPQRLRIGNARHMRSSSQHIHSPKHVHRDLHSLCRQSPTLELPLARAVMSKWK